MSFHRSTLPRWLPFAALSLVGCDGGGDDPVTGTASPAAPFVDDAVSAPSPDAYLIGGTVCEAGPEPAVGAIDCTAPPRTDLAGPGLPPTGEGTLGIDGRRFTLDALVRVRFVVGADAADRRIAARLLLHDGSTRLRENADDTGARRIDYGAYGGLVALSLDLFPAGPGGGFSGRTFEVLPGADANDPALAGAGFSNGGAFALDGDGDGTIRTDELVPVVGGTLTWLDAGPDALSLDFELLLEDGRRLGGSYLGGFALVE